MRRFKVITYQLFLWWFALWVVACLILFFVISASSSNGFVVKRDCVVEKSNICQIYSSSYQVPFLVEYRINIVAAAILIGAFVIIFGVYKSVIRKNSFFLQSKTR